jgi:hypothetical protein
MPEVLPHYGDLLVDASGRIWIADYATDPDAPSRWTVISPEGRELGIVRLPANFTIKRAGADYVTGVWRDELDVEYVQVWTLSQDRQTC